MISDRPTPTRVTLICLNAAGISGVVGFPCFLTASALHDRALDLASVVYALSMCSLGFFLAPITYLAGIVVAGGLMLGIVPTMLWLSRHVIPRLRFPLWVIVSGVCGAGLMALMGEPNAPVRATLALAGPIPGWAALTVVRISFPTLAFDAPDLERAMSGVPILRRSRRT
jgi:hypothetical protein